MNYFIGIDNSSLDHKVRVIDQNGKLKSSFTVENSLNGFEMLKKNWKEFLILKLVLNFPMDHWSTFFMRKDITFIHSTL